MKELIISLTGEITASNFDEFKGDLIKQIKAANKELKTDEDFVNAADIVKDFHVAEKSLIDAKTSALEEAADIQKLFVAIDEVSAETRAARLSLEKQIKTRKEEIKKDLIEAADLEIAQTIKGQNDDFTMAMAHLDPGIIYSMAGLHKSVKNKKTFESMKSSLDDYVAESLERLVNVSGSVAVCREMLDKIETKHKPLFQDEGRLLSLSVNEFNLETSKRIAVFEAEEAKRQAAELQQKEDDRIKAEEEAERTKQEEAIDTAIAAGSNPDPDTYEPQAIENPVVKTNKPQAAPSGPNKQLKAPDYIVTVLISGTQEDAMSVANTIDEQIGNSGCVTKIKLQRQRAAA